MVAKTRAQAILVAIVVLGPTAATAQQPSVRQACAADLQQYCGEARPGEGRLGACAEQHFSEFSEPCKKVLLSNVDVVKVCKPDVERTCSNIEPGGGRIQLCMKDHFAEYSHPCRRAIIIAKFGSR
jgi:hypothetical protein